MRAQQLLLTITTLCSIYSSIVARPELKITHYTTDDGLPHNTVYTALPAEGFLWLSTDDGLCHFDPRTRTARNFGVADGLTHYEFNRNSFFKASDGTLYFGGLNGLNAFNPKDLLGDLATNSQLLFTKFSKYNARIDSLIEQVADLNRGTTITLEHNDKFFTFQYALSDYTGTRKEQLCLLSGRL